MNEFISKISQINDVEYDDINYRIRSFAKRVNSQGQ